MVVRLGDFGDKPMPSLRNQALPGTVLRGGSVTLQILVETCARTLNFIYFRFSQKFLHFHYVLHYKTLKIYTIKDIPKISLIECDLETGRTHQIRVHLKYKGTSLLGDKQYGKKNIKFKRINNEFFEKLNKLSGQALHAKTLEFTHPVTKKWMSFNSDLPSSFKKILKLLENLTD